MAQANGRGLDRSCRRQLNLMVSQLPTQDWHHAIVAGAILERLMHNAHLIKLKGDRCANAGRPTSAC